MKHYDKLYIRTKANVPFSEESYPLAFATPYEDNAAGRKRQETVDNWANVRRYAVWDSDKNHYVQHEAPDPGDAHILDNVPLEGFKIYDVNSRYRTNNKFFTVYDPRGFSLEIDTYNLLDILEKGTIEKGVIKGKMIWYRSGPSNYLQFYDENITVESKKITSGAAPGDLLEISYGECIYVGKAYRASIKYEYTGGDERIDSSRYRYATWKEYLNYDYTFDLVPNEKPVHVFLDEKNKCYHIYKSMPKYSIAIKAHSTHSIKDFLDSSFKKYEASSDYKTCGKFYFVSQSALDVFCNDMKNPEYFMNNAGSEFNSIITNKGGYSRYVFRNVNINGKLFKAEQLLNFIVDNQTEV